MIRTHGRTHYDPDTCYGCKLLSVEFGKPTFQPHYNHAVGKFVRSQREFDDALKRASHSASERTGIHHNYEPIHPSDLVNNAPPEKAPSHLDHLTDLKDDPTLPENRIARQVTYDSERTQAEALARSKDLIHADV